MMHMSDERVVNDPLGSAGKLGRDDLFFLFSFLAPNTGVSRTEALGRGKVHCQIHIKRFHIIQLLGFLPRISYK